MEYYSHKNILITIVLNFESADTLSITVHYQIHGPESVINTSIINIISEESDQYIKTVYPF